MKRFGSSFLQQREYIYQNVHLKTVKMVNFCYVFFTRNFFKNLGFEQRKQNLGNLKKILEDYLIALGISGKPKAPRLACKNKQGWESGNSVFPLNWRVFCVPLTGKHPIINLRFVNIMKKNLKNKNPKNYKRKTELKEVKGLQQQVHSVLN